MSLNPYLFFDGNCREVFEFYRSVFGGEFSVIMTFGDGPPDLNVPESEVDRIMHVSLPIGSAVLMGSDSCSVFGSPPVAGDNFAISVIGESREHCDDVFARLSEGGTVTMPMQETFWGAYFGTWKDRFGINWMINYELPKEQGRAGALVFGQGGSVVLQVGLAEGVIRRTGATSEYPVEFVQDYGQVLRGRIDLVIETESGWIVVDHKSSPRPRSEQAAEAIEYSGQLAAYACALRRSGLQCAGCWLHLPAGGGLVEVLVDSPGDLMRSRTP